MLTKPEDVHPEKLHLILVVPETHAEIMAEDLLQGINTKGVLTAIVPKPSFQVYASYEWIQPGAITALILKGLFEGFLKEAGKDGYVLIKAWLKGVASRARLIKVHTIVSNGSTEKLDSSYSQSRSFTPRVQLKDGTSIKLLFDERLSNAEWEEAIERIFEQVADHYENYPNDFLSAKIASLQKDYRQSLYALIDMESREWVLLTDQMLVARQRANNI